jgi:hypothetical protein
MVFLLGRTILIIDNERPHKTSVFLAEMTRPEWRIAGTAPDDDPV